MTTCRLGIVERKSEIPDPDFEQIAGLPTDEAFPEKRQPVIDNKET